MIRVYLAENPRLYDLEVGSEEADSEAGVDSEAGGGSAAAGGSVAGVAAKRGRAFLSLGCNEYLPYTRNSSFRHFEFGTFWW
jgi:hypothetical protein